MRVVRINSSVPWLAQERMSYATASGCGDCLHSWFHPPSVSLLALVVHTEYTLVPLFIELLLLFLC